MNPTKEMDKAIAEWKELYAQILETVAEDIEKEKKGGSK